MAKRPQRQKTCQREACDCDEEGKRAAQPFEATARPTAARAGDEASASTSPLVVDNLERQEVDQHSRSDDPEHSREPPHGCGRRLGPTNQDDYDRTQRPERRCDARNYRPVDALVFAASDDGSDPVDDEPTEEQVESQQRMRASRMALSLAPTPVFPVRHRFNRRDRRAPRKEKSASCGLLVLASDQRDSKRPGVDEPGVATGCAPSR